MREVALLIGLDGGVLYNHEPEDRTSVFLPDSLTLWDRIWAYRTNLAGIAHSHPGSASPTPSMEDLTTFAAVEAGLGKRLIWWIVSSDGFAELIWIGPDKLHYGVKPHKRRASSYSWVEELRKVSEYSHGDNILEPIYNTDPQHVGEWVKVGLLISKKHGWVKPMCELCDNPCVHPCWYSAQREVYRCTNCFSPDLDKMNPV
jgi:proteasome lid subunit RPN8/RPN11